MKFLLVQNRGVAETESFTLLGASGLGEGKIGKFGSGTKLAVTQCLREGVAIRAYCGKTKLDFGLRTDEFEGHPVDRVTVKEGNLKSRDLGWTKDWGESDWDDITMALREFVSNAVDRSGQEGGYKAALESGDLVVTVESKARAKAGYTRIYVELTPAVEKFLEELPRRFLHFAGADLDQEILPKANRSIKGTGNACVYRMGVLVCELDGDSVYDYNFGPDDITIDECRNANEYSVRAEIAKRLRRASADELTPIFEKLGGGDIVMETGLDPHYLCGPYTTPTEEEKNNWSDAWNRCFQEAVMTDSEERNLKYVQRKGYKGQAIDSEAWRVAMKRLGIQSHTDVLSPYEQNGRQLTGATEALHVTARKIWEVALTQDLTGGKEAPRVACFTSDDDDRVKVFVEDGTIFVRDDVASRDDNTFINTVLLGVAEYAGHTRLEFITDLASKLIIDYF